MLKEKLAVPRNAAILVGLIAALAPLDLYISCGRWVFLYAHFVDTAN